MDHWKGNDLITHVVDAAFTAADIDDGREIARSDAKYQVCIVRVKCTRLIVFDVLYVQQLQRGDLVYANWRDMDRWFYGRITNVGVRAHTHTHTHTHTQYHTNA